MSRQPGMCGMRCGFIGPDSIEWNRFLADSTHDFYHLPKYVEFSAHDRLCAPDGDGQPLAFHAEDESGNRLLIAMIVRPIPIMLRTSSPLFDAITPYGYASPLVIRGGDQPVELFLSKAIEHFRKELQSRGIVSAFIRSHPVIPFPFELLSDYGSVVQHGTTVYIDLTLPFEELWRQTRGSHKNPINRARRNGFKIDIQSDWKDFEEFYRAYIETMRRVGASEHYFFPREYFMSLREAIGNVLHLAICHKDGVVACGGIFSEVCGIVQYHLSGTTEEFFGQYPSKVFIDSVRTWAKERGNRLMHLGGGYGGSEDSLFEFKAGFSELRSPFYTWRVISDTDQYTNLCQQWEALTGKTVSSQSGFFPAYRAI